MTTLRMISSDAFADKYPKYHKGPSNEYVKTALELHPGEGFEIPCPGTHYYREKDNARYACSVQNKLNRYAREHNLLWRTTHNGDNLMVLNPTPEFEMSVDVELAKQVRATDRVIAALVDQFAPVFGSEDAVRREIDDALNHKAADKRKDKRRYLLTWLTRAAERFATRQANRATMTAFEVYKRQQEQQ